MLHNSSPSRFRLIPTHLRLLNRSIFSHWISVSSHHHQTQINAHDELVDFFEHLLRQCTAIQQTKQIHTQILLSRSYCSAFLAATLVSVYSKIGLLSEARKVFETTPIECISSLLLWNSIMRASATNGEFKETLGLYLKMRNLGVWADGFTFPLVARACGILGNADLCKIVHCHVLLMGFGSNLHVVNEILGMYKKIGRMDVARQLFDRMLVRNYISWNTMVSGFSLNYDCDRAVEMFRRMESEGWEPNLVTWTSLLSSHARCGRYEKTLQLFAIMRNKCIGATPEVLSVVLSVCADSRAFARGQAIHGYVTEAGFGNYSSVNNSLICMYGRHGSVKDANFLFSETGSKNLVSWNAMISSYAESGLCDEAFALFSQLEKLDNYLLMKPDVISWSAVINGFASNGRCEDSLELFRQMQLAKVNANSLTISSVLSACAEISALVLGREIHAHVIRGSIDSNTFVGNGLINMYTKCGGLREGHLAFERIDDRDLFSWNTLISGYGMHGFGENALVVFDQMIKSGYKPDKVTFVAVLSACSHAGLVTEGHKLFEQMTSQFEIEPQVQHYACMVDLLGRAGFLQEARDIAKSMPMEPNACVWGALLNPCRMYKSADVAEESVSQLLRLEPAMAGSYMLLSNIYAARGRWEDSARVRVAARTSGLKKMPGQSWIEVNKKVHMFSSGNAVQMGMKEVCSILRDLSLLKEMEMENFVADDSFVLQNEIEERHANGSGRNSF